MQADFPRNVQPGLRGSSLVYSCAGLLHSPVHRGSRATRTVAANIFHATERMSRVGLIGDRVWRF